MSKNTCMSLYFKFQMVINSSRLNKETVDSGVAQSTGCKLKCKYLMCALLTVTCNILVVHHMLNIKFVLFKNTKLSSILEWLLMDNSEKGFFPIYFIFSFTFKQRQKAKKSSTDSFFLLWSAVCQPLPSQSTTPCVFEFTTDNYLRISEKKNTDITLDTKSILLIY